MNASGYLKGQGWRGEGHSLDTTNRGLSRPLLVTHKVDLAGLGTKKNDFGNQWWMDSFDKSLKGAMKIQIVCLSSTGTNAHWDADPLLG